MAALRKPDVELVNGVVRILYDDLLDPTVDLSQHIEKAYGYEGLGILIVKGIPKLTEYRNALLPLAHKFANFPEEIKNKVVHKESFYSFGWSHGREKLEGKPDFSKGSYYNNPLYDTPVDDPELIKKYPSFCAPNLWPKEDLPELEPAFKNLGKLIVDTGLLLAKHCDKYVNSKCNTYPASRLHDIIKESKTCKARLLHYFPLNRDEVNEDMYSSWCGWHNDHGSLTGLVSAMYINKEGKEVPVPDSKAGLYIKSRAGELVKANIPTDHLAFQIGETAQIHSGGVLQATPHCVRGAQGASSRDISRNTYAVFMEPMWSEKMDIPTGSDVENVLKGSGTKHLPPGVPALGTRWERTQDFGQFTEKTLNAYY